MPKGPRIFKHTLRIDVTPQLYRRIKKVTGMKGWGYQTHILRSAIVALVERLEKHMDESEKRKKEEENNGQ